MKNNSNYNWFIITVFGVLLYTHAMADDDGQDFIDGFGGIPLLSGYEIVPDQTVIFDTLAGTIAETILKKKNNQLEPLGQYQAALKPLGWACIKNSKLTCKKDGYGFTVSILSDGPYKGELKLNLKPLTKQKP